MSEGDSGWQQRDLVPRPDPTVLTNQAIAQVTTQYKQELAGLREILEGRMEAMDHARALLLQIMDERTAETGRRFAERDLRFNERDAARQEAVRTALAAAKDLSDARDAATDKANEKFEATVREQIAQLGALAAANREQLSTEITALKERIDRSDGISTGQSGQRTEGRAGRAEFSQAAAAIIAGVSALIAIVAVIVLIVKK